MLLLTTVAALAQDGSNSGLSVDASVVYRLNDEHGWGVRLGVGAQVILGDACGYWVRSSCRQNTGVAGSLWPTLAPLFAVGWQGGPRFAAELLAGLGVSSAQVYDFGFIPHWQLFATPGWHWEAEGDVHGFSLGGLVTTSLSPTFFELNPNLAVPFALRLAAGSVWATDGWSTVSLTGGMQVGMIGSFALD